MRILALDPGGTTGTVMVDWDGSLPPTPESVKVIESDQVAFNLMPDWIVTALDLGPDLVVVERFFISERTIRGTRQMEPLYVIGGVLFECARRGLPVRLQAASSAKMAYPNERLEGWPVKGRHARDALRHALVATHAKELQT